MCFGDTLFVFILTEGSAAFAYDIIQFFRNSMDYIVNLFLRENKHKLVSALIIKGCHKLSCFAAAQCQAGKRPLNMADSENCLLFILSETLPQLMKNISIRNTSKGSFRRLEGLFCGV